MVTIIIIIAIKIIQIAMFIEHLLCGRYCFMCFTFTDVFNPHYDTMR